MTTTLKGCAVAFAHDIREDDAEKILEAIQCLRGVLTVRPIEASPSDDWIVEERVRRDLEKKLWAVLRPAKRGEGDR